MTTSRLPIGVVGTGALGRHHARILNSLDGAELVGIYDASPAVAKAIAEEHGTRAWPSLEELAERVSAMVLAVPTVDHANIGCALLEQGIDVLVEKPIAATLEEADRLLAAAGEDRILAVGHVEFHNPAVQVLLENASGPRYLDIQRLSPFTRRSLDVDVILDLMIHDLQILHALDPSPVAEVRATGIEVLSQRVDMANVRIELASGMVATLTASRVSSDRVRKLRAYLPSSYFSLDYQDQELKGVRLEMREGAEPMILPAELSVEKGEPLRRELEAFLGACRREKELRWVDGKQGRRALATAFEVLEAIGRSKARYESSRQDG